MRYFVEILTALLGTLGFSVVFRSKKEHLAVLSVGGAVSWAAYILASFVFESEPVCYFIAAAIVAVYAEVFARVLKTPATNVLIPALLPMIPGGGLYYTMRFAISEDWQSFFSRGGATLAIALAIALGIISVSTVTRLLFVRNRH